jgi:hypothetical protein
MQADDAMRGGGRADCRRSRSRPGGYILATIHRPENTGDPVRLGTILDEPSKLGLRIVSCLQRYLDARSR